MDAFLAHDEIQSLRSQLREAQIENKALDQKNRELSQQIVDQDAAGTYCPTCGSCGETGCCPPTKCQEVKCHFGESNIRDYDVVCTEAWALELLTHHVVTTSHCAAMVGTNMLGALLKINAQCSFLLYQLHQLRLKTIPEERKAQIKKIETYMLEHAILRCVPKS